MKKAGGNAKARPGPGGKKKKKALGGGEFDWESK